MALSCFSFSSFTRSLFCISICMTLTRLPCTRRRPAVRTPRPNSSEAAGGALTHAFFLPLELRVGDGPVQPLLQAPLVRQLPLQPLRSGLQLALQRALVILVVFCCFLQDVNLKQNIMGGLYKERSFTPFIQGLNGDFFFLFRTLCSYIFVLFSRRSISDLLFWMILSFSDSLSLCSWTAFSVAAWLLSSC